MDESLFYIAGIALMVVALIISFIGMRSDKFPSGRMLGVGIVVIFLLVAATAVGAVELAKHEDEQGGELEAANTEADVQQSSQTATEQQAGAAPADTPAEKPAGGGSTTALVEEGKQVFVSTGCGSCHTVVSLGSDAQGTIGPNLTTALTQDDQAAIKEMIVDPQAEIAKGFPGGTMPTNYGDQLTPEQLDALTAFLFQESHSPG